MSKIEGIHFSRLLSLHMKHFNNTYELMMKEWSASIADLWTLNTFVMCLVSHLWTWEQFLALLWLLQIFRFLTPWHLKSITLLWWNHNPYHLYAMIIFILRHCQLYSFKLWQYHQRGRLIWQQDSRLGGVLDCLVLTCLALVKECINCYHTSISIDWHS